MIRSSDDRTGRGSRFDRGRRALTAIAVFKLCKATVLVASGVGLLELLHGDQTAAARAAARAASPFGQRAAAAIAANIDALTPGRIELLGAGAFVYAAIFAVEGIGLWLARPWAERLTLVVTASFLPIETYELVRATTPFRVLVVIVNAAVVAYLARRAWTDTRQRA